MTTERSWSPTCGAPRRTESICGPNTIVLGIGDPTGGDAAVGWAVAQALTGLVSSPRVRLDLACTGGWHLFELLDGFHRAVLIDAFHADSGSEGRLVCVRNAGEADLDFLHVRARSLFGSLAAPPMSRFPLPEAVSLWGIGVRESRRIRTRLNSRLERMIPALAKRILAEEHESFTGA